MTFLFAAEIALISSIPAFPLPRGENSQYVITAKKQQMPNAGHSGFSLKANTIPSVNTTPKTRTTIVANDVAALNPL